MNTKMLRHVRGLYSNRNYQRQWIRSVRFLGDRWLLATPVEKKDLTSLPTSGILDAHFSNS